MIILYITDQYPVQSSSASKGEDDLPSVKTQQVTGSIIPRNISSVDLQLPSPISTDYYQDQNPESGQILLEIHTR